MLNHATMPEFGKLFTAMIAASAAAASSAASVVSSAASAAGSVAFSVIGYDPNGEVVSLSNTVPQRYERDVQAAQPVNAPDQGSDELSNKELEIIKGVQNIVGDETINPKDVRVHELPFLEQRINNFRPNGMEKKVRIQAIQHETVRMQKFTATPANKNFMGDMTELNKNILDVDDIWFVIQYLFALIKKISKMLSLKGKGNTGMPAYYILIQIITRWACIVFIHNKENPKFLNDFKKILANSNSVLSKADLRNEKKRNADGQPPKKKPKTEKLIESISAYATAYEKHAAEYAHYVNNRRRFTQPVAQPFAQPITQVVVHATDPKDAVPAAADPKDVDSQSDSDIPEMD